MSKTTSKFSVMESWAIFSAKEKRNIAIYILGIMCYKFGLEAFNGSIVTLATNRYDWDAARGGYSPNTLERVGLLVGLNQAFQCVGSILIAPLVKRFPTKNVLSCAIFCFGLLTAILLIVDSSRGGRFRPQSRAIDSENFDYFGDYNTDGIIPVYSFAGICYGMVELIRRVMPRDIVGGNVQKLRRMDALVHIFYEVAGTAAAFVTALALIPRFGYNFAFLITPPIFTVAAVVWFFINSEDFEKGKTESHIATPEAVEKAPTFARAIWTYLKAVGEGFLLFTESIWTGAKIIFSSRKFIWLLPGYSFALYGHRYLENGIAPAYAKRILGVSAWSQIMVGGSNFGELLGAAFVFFFTNVVRTPLPWLRLDAIMLLIVWYLPWFDAPSGQVQYAWMIAATFIPISFGWAAGDVSLAAYIQASLARKEATTTNVSALGAVMAFLYSTYIVMYAIASPLLGRYLDGVYEASGETTITPASIRNVGPIQFTILAVIIFAATFIPKGAFHFNPKDLYGENLDQDLEDEESLTVDAPTEVAKDGIMVEKNELTVREGYANSSDDDERPHRAS